MQHDVHGVVFRAAAGGGQSVCDQRGAASLRGQAVLQPHVIGHAVGQAAPVTAEPVCVVTPVKCLQCGQLLQQAGFRCSWPRLHVWCEVQLATLLILSSYSPQVVGEFLQQIACKILSDLIYRAAALHTLIGGRAMHSGNDAA